MLPQWPHLGLTAHVPHGEADVDVLRSLHIEADGGQGGHHFPPLYFVQHRVLAILLSS